MGLREERVAANETTFRRANEDLRARWGELGLPRQEPLLFICECGEPRCTELMRLTLDEYESVRRDANTFALVRGHEDNETERLVTEEIVAASDRFAVVRKRTDYRTDTEATDPRAAP